MVSLDVLSIAWTCTPCIVPGRECGVGLDALHPRFGSLPHPREHLLPDHMTRPIPVRAEGHFFLSSFASPGDIASLGLGSLQRRPTFPAHLLGGDQGSPS